MRAAEKAWIGLAAGVAAYDVLCPKGETLSEGMDRFLEHDRYRYLALGGVAITAAHLLNLIPNELDPFAHALSWKDR